MFDKFDKKIRARSFVNAGGTYGFLGVGDTLRKITLADGTDVTLTTNSMYTALCYGGDSVLYGATPDGLYSIAQDTGVATLITKIQNIDNIIYKDTDEIWVLTGNSMMLVDITDGSYTFVLQNL
jgi:hypothetical protein